ncbi:hypothetical protein JOD63_000611 [Microbacterium terrae]|uniref:DUF2867 domain-containing protein n=1 Tax=Microbacterium terrae TaxID=69369 RepID=A0A0M2HD04_9MICO|nr:hypothetical protein [Microbacterium terrae]KJL42094.1 hypothetical protein RS81_01252 [Microbacterium terrae]MBP1076643.1 hypothetical protein [Microbacterium terrae]GLJ97472.1 hypothetical protein GCM10017594_06690 [Microbacterium terrae]
MAQPMLWSLALEDIADPDYTQVWLDVLPAHATADPAAWARNLFSTAALPRWVASAVAVATLGRRAGHCTTFDVRRVQSGEALVGIDARRVDVRFGIGVDEEHALIRVVSAMRFKGGGSRLWTLPARLGLAVLMRGMIARARRHLSGVTR